MKRILLLIMLVLFAVPAFATNYNAASCSAADVNTAITSAGTSTGNSVTIPAGSCDWSTNTPSWQGISVIGAGYGTSDTDASATIITNGKPTITSSSSYVTRMTGIRFINNHTHFKAQAPGSSFPYKLIVIDLSYFYNTGQDDSVPIWDIETNGILMYRNKFHADEVDDNAGTDVMFIHPGEDWSAATTMGRDDSTGTRNIYFEDNVCEYLYIGLDNDQGARLDVRGNTMTDCAVVQHGGNGTYNDTSSSGARQLAIYKNKFVRTQSDSSNVPNGWVWVRGGTMVFALNSMDSVNTSNYGNKNQIALTNGCSNGSDSYPVAHQVGQTSDTAGTPSQPVLMFGNTAGANNDGTTDMFLGTGENDTGGGATYTDCNNSGVYIDNYIHSGRDYYTSLSASNPWFFLFYPYPHPARYDQTSLDGNINSFSCSPSTNTTSWTNPADGITYPNRVTETCTVVTTSSGAFTGRVFWQPSTLQYNSGATCSASRPVLTTADNGSGIVGDNQLVQTNLANSTTYTWTFVVGTCAQAFTLSGHTYGYPAN